MINCAYCAKTDKQVKAGFNASGTQRYLCRHCDRRYTPEPKQVGHDELTRQQAVELAQNGLEQRKIAHLLGVSQGSVSNWVNAAQG